MCLLSTAKVFRLWRLQHGEGGCCQRKCRKVEAFGVGTQPKSTTTAGVTGGGVATDNGRERRHQPDRGDSADHRSQAIDSCTEQTSLGWPLSIQSNIEFGHIRSTSFIEPSTHVYADLLPRDWNVIYQTMRIFFRANPHHTHTFI